MHVEDETQLAIYFEMPRMKRAKQKASLVLPTRRYTVKPVTRRKESNRKTQENVTPSVQVARNKNGYVIMTDFFSNFPLLGCTLRVRLPRAGERRTSRGRRLCTSRIRR
jgi:hypothetical protein